MGLGKFSHSIIISSNESDECRSRTPYLVLCLNAQAANAISFFESTRYTICEYLDLGISRVKSRRDRL